MNDLRKNLLKLALWCLILAVIVLAFSYYFYHYVTDGGFTLEWHEQPGKPFVSTMIAELGVLSLFASIISLFSAFIFGKGQKK